jgi:hypothetical protein
MKAIASCYEILPYFGDRDFVLSENCNVDKTKCYSQFGKAFDSTGVEPENAAFYLAGSYSFTVKEIETFLVE